MYAEETSNRPLRRESANPSFDDVQFYDPPATGLAGEPVSMLIRATSTVEMYHAALFSHAMAFLHRADNEEPVPNGGAPGSALRVQHDPDLDLGSPEGTATVLYEWPRLVLPEPGTYFYRVYIMGTPEGGVMASMGVYDSRTIRVSA